MMVHRDSNVTFLGHSLNLHITAVKSHCLKGLTLRKERVTGGRHRESDGIRREEDGHKEGVRESKTEYLRLVGSLHIHSHHIWIPTLRKKKKKKDIKLLSHFVLFFLIAFKCDKEL